MKYVDFDSIYKEWGFLYNSFESNSFIPVPGAKSRNRDTKREYTEIVGRQVYP